MGNENNKLDLDSIKKECFSLIETLNNLVTVISDKSMLTVNEKQLQDYKIQFVQDCKKLEDKMNVLRNQKAPIDDLLKEYNELNERIDNKEFKSLVNKKEIEQDIAQREMEKLVDSVKKQIEAETGVDANEIKIVTMKKPSSKPLTILLDAIKTLLFNLFILLGLNGFIPWQESKSIVSLILFIVYYSAIEIALKTIITIGFKKYIIKTFGFILALAPILAFVLSYAFPLGLVKIESLYIYLLVCLLAYLIKRYIGQYLLNKSIQNFSKKKKSKKTKK